jgi:phospholipid/cholesterol/gamma-HCH transport system substrate-binding protein
MNETSSKRAVIVGLFVLVGLIILVTGILMVGNLHDTFQPKIKVVSLFPDVSGLKKGSNIWFSGVKVGVVSGLKFYGKSQVAVDLSIENKVQQYIRQDAKVKLSTDGLIGNKILIIYGGTGAFPEVVAGDTLEVEKTFTNEDMINMLQANNENLLEITTSFKTISTKLAAGEGTIGKLLNDNTLYENINSSATSLHKAIDVTASSLNKASAQAQQLLASLNTFSAGLNKKGTLVQDLVSDTVVFNSVKSTARQLQLIADTARVMVKTLQIASRNPKTALGVLLYDESSGANMKATLQNMESSSLKLDEDLKAVQHNFLLRRYFKNKAKAKE